MPDQREQGPLDPAFAKFREQKLVEKLTEKVNSKIPPKVAERIAPAASSVSVKDLPDPGKAMEIAVDDPELGKFLTRKINEAQADEAEKDDARLVFGASLPRPVSPNEGGSPRPVSPSEGGSPRPVSPSEGGSARNEPTLPSRGAVSPKPPTATLAKPPAPKPPSGGVAKAGPVLPSTKLPPRQPAAPQGDVVSQLVAIGTGLNAILGESAQRNLELKVANNEGMGRALEALEAEARRVREYVARGESIAAETAQAARSVDEKAAAQDALEEQVRQMRARADGIAARVAGLRAAIDELEAMAAKSETEVAELGSEVETKRGEVNALTERLASASDQAAELTRNRDRIQENVERLYGLCQGHKDAIARLKDMKDGLTKPVA